MMIETKVEEIKTIQGRNNTIDILRMACAILVIGIHTGLLYGNGVLPPIVERVNSFAVPFFAVISGYFLSANYEKKGHRYIYIYILKLVLLYFFISAVFYTQMINEQRIADGSIHFNAKFFFFSQARFGHIWYLVALGLYAAVFLLFAVVIKKLKINANVVIIFFLLLLNILQALRGPYYNLIHNDFTAALTSDVHQAVKRYILRGFSAFLMGTFMYQNRDILLKIPKKKTVMLLIVSLILYVLEAFITVKTGLAKSAMSAAEPCLPIMALFLFALQNPNILSTDPRHGRYCRKMSAFIYYFHPYWLYWFRDAAPWVGDCTAADKFVICFVLTFIIGNVLYKINNKYLNLLFS